MELARQFRGRGYQVDILNLTGDGELASEVPDGVGYKPLTNHGARTSIGLIAKALPPLIRYLRTARPDVIFSSMTGTNLLTVLAHACTGGQERLVVREAAALINTRGLVTRGLMRMLYPRADAVLAVSAGVSNDLKRLGIDPSIVHVIHNPIDAERVRTLAALARPLPTSSEAPFVITIGRLTIQKDHGTLLHAFASSELRLTHRLIIVGEGVQREHLVALARKLGIENQVELVGSLVNPYPILERAALFVLSSRWEGYPNVLLEALALGVPVVATDCPSGPRELLQDGRYGRLAPVGDHLALARAMDDELQEPARHRDEVIAAHQPRLVAQRYLALIDGFEIGGEE